MRFMDADRKLWTPLPAIGAAVEPLGTRHQVHCVLALCLSRSLLLADQGVQAITK